MGDRRPWRLRRQGRGLGSDDLLCDRQVGIARIQLACEAQQSLDLRQASPRIGLDERRHQDPVGPGLGHHGIRLGAIEQVIALLAQLSGLFRRGGSGQGLVCRLQLLLQLIYFLFQGEEFPSGILILFQCGNGLGNLVGIDLCSQIDSNDDDVSIEIGFDLLIEDQHHAGRVAADFILGDIQIPHHRHAFQVRGDLFQRLFLGLFRCKSDGVIFGLSIAHPMFPGSGDDSNLGSTSIGPGEHGAEVDRAQTDEGKETALPRGGWASEGGVYRGINWEHRLTRDRPVDQ